MAGLQTPFLTSLQSSLQQARPVAAQQTSGNTTFSAGDSPQACRTNNLLGKRQSDLASCRDQRETVRIDNFIKDTYNIQSDFDTQNAMYNDLVIQGDNLFGTAKTNLQVDDIRKRNKELQDMKDKLQGEINTANAAAERAERDFLDTKAKLPDPIPKKMLHTIEDYTMLVFLMSYTLMGIALIYLYAANQGFAINSIITGLVGAFVITLFIGVLIYNIL
jgi:hypothetical protein